MRTLQEKRLSQSFGEGKYTNTEGSTYEGIWKFDKQDGQGKEMWSDGSSYEGTYVMGVKEGFGKYYWAKDNASYQGEWK